jgi:hypothetical protein
MPRPRRYPGRREYVLGYETREFAPLGAGWWSLIPFWWSYRVELAMFAPTVALAWLLGGTYGWGAAVLVAIADYLVVKFCPPINRWYTRVLHRARLRRHWRRATTAIGLEAYGPGPRIRSIQEIPAGDQLTIRVAYGTSVSDLEHDAERLAACLGVREIRVSQDPTNAQHARVVLVRRDSLADLSAMPWPHASAERLSLWDPIPFGVDENGRTLALDLVERNLLIGGEPGAGKSVALSLIAATGAMDVSCRLWLLDGKVVELACWRHSAEHLASTHIEDANEVLRRLRDVVEDRYRDLLAAGLRKIDPASGLPLHLLVCDELAFYVTHPDKKARQEFVSLLRDIVSRGRAAGVIVCAATQKPGSEVVPTSLRDLFGFRLALRCNTPQASDTILGQGWASKEAGSYDASKIPGGQRGTGYLLAEDDRPRKLRTFHLDDQAMRQLADRAAELRRPDDGVWSVTNPETPIGGAPTLAATNGSHPEQPERVS